jgi:replicative DNA helicase
MNAQKTSINQFDRARDAEMALLGGMLANSRMPEVATLSTLVDSSDFSDKSLGKLFAMLLEMQDDGHAISDVGLVRQRAIDSGIFDEIGGRIGLAEIITKASTAPSYYATQVRKFCHKRKMVEELQFAVKELNDPTIDQYKTAKSLAESLDALSARREIEFESIGEIASKIIDELDKPAKPLILSGLGKFDREIGGFAPGELIVLAARTSLGKSALAAQIGEFNAKEGLPILFVTLEMEGSDIVRRILSRDSQVNVKAMRSSNVTSEGRKAILSAASQTDGVRLYPHYMPTAKVRDIRQVAKSFKNKFGIGMIVVDYLQIISSPDRRMSIRETVGDSTRTLKQLAGELDCPVLTLSQLNRASTKQEAPTLANLSESSNIEADADIVMAIHRHSPNEQEGQLLILKNRNGETLDLNGLMWNGQAMQFWFKGDNQFSGFEAYS